MPSTSLSQHICPACERAHLNVTAEGRRMLLILGVSETDIETLTHQGDAIAAEPAPARHRQITEKDRAIMMLQLSMTPAQIDAIAVEAQLRAIPDSQRIETYGNDILEQLAALDPDTYVEVLTDLENQIAAASVETPEQRARRLNRERQDRFRARHHGRKKSDPPK